MKKKNNKGFSLIELIIAIAILVILTGLLAPQFMRYLEKSREAKDMQTLDSVYSAVQIALSEENAYKFFKIDGNLSALKKGGMEVETLLNDASPDAFTKEIQDTLGSIKTDTMWACKAINDNNVKAKGGVYILIDDKLKVTVWAGNSVTDTTVAEADILSSAAGSANGILTAGTRFCISK